MKGHEDMLQEVHKSESRLNVEATLKGEMGLRNEAQER